MKKIQSYADLQALQASLPSGKEPNKRNRTGGILKVKSFSGTEVSFDRTQKEVLRALETLYGRTDLVQEEGSTVAIYVPAGDIGSWIGSSGLMVAALKEIFDAESVKIYDLAARESHCLGEFLKHKLEEAKVAIKDAQGLMMPEGTPRTTLTEELKFVLRGRHIVMDGQLGEWIQSYYRGRGFKVKPDWHGIGVQKGDDSLFVTITNGSDTTANIQISVSRT